MNKRALIITYYWPPSGGGGVQRWLKFAKYLPELGWQPVVMTPENPDFELRDSSLLSDVPACCELLKIPIREPFALYRKLPGKKATQQQGVVSKEKGSPLSKWVVWLRGNLFIPDARMLWIRPASRYLIQYLRKHPVDVIITTGPPHSMHLVGVRVKKKTGIPWLADFRDPWSQWDVLPQLQLTKSSWKKHKRLEFEVLNSADKVLTVSKRLARALDERAGVPAGVEVINNGYDESDFADFEPQKPDKFRLVHTGLLNEGRNPTGLWKALNQRCAHDSGFAADLEVVLAGTIEQSVKVRMAGWEHLKDRVKVLDYVSHREALEINQSAAVFLLLVNDTANASWILPGKLYEYLACRKPILAFGSKESDANDILQGCGYHSFLAYNRQKGIEERLNKLYLQYKNGEHWVDASRVDRFSRKKLTEALAVMLEDLALL